MKVSCEIDNQMYENQDISNSYKRLYNDTLSSDTVKDCETNCNNRKGCGAFLINSVSKLCVYYGFETVKIEIANIDEQIQH